MNFFSPRLLLVFAGGLLLEFSAAAGNSIKFSKPVDSELVNRANAGLPSATDGRSVAGGIRAPAEIFNSAPPDFPVPPPVVVLPPTDAMKEALNRRDKWTLLTPEEILGVPTAEKILGVPDAKNEDKLSSEERFLLRLQRDRSTANSALSALQQQDAAQLRGDNHANPMARSENRRLFEKVAMDAQPGSPKYFSQLLNGIVNSSSDVNPIRPDSPWVTAFTQPNQLPPTPAQQAGIERFRALMEPNSPPDKTLAVRGYLPASAANPNMQPKSLLNPLGSSYQPLKQNISRPQGIAPLADITGFSTPPAASPVSAQTPPWLQSSPQTFSLPQRKF